MNIGYFQVLFFIFDPIPKLINDQIQKYFIRRLGLYFIQNKIKFLHIVARHGIKQTSSYI